MQLILPDGNARTLGRESSTVEDILRQEGINPLEVMVMRNGKLLTEDTVVGSDDIIRVIRISHGG